jgi:hypothetical protein
MNDKREFFYGFEAVQRAALNYAYARLPDDLKREFDFDEGLEEAIQGLQDQSKAGDGYGQVYTFSFARGSTDDHDERGLLTLWDRYAKLEGYCLQFLESDIRDKLRFEMDRSTFIWAGLKPVRYGYDTLAPNFVNLARELGERALLDVFKATEDPRIPINVQGRMVQSMLVQSLLEFCTTHKDPFFEDERELRLVFSPAPSAAPRFLTGAAMPKRIQSDERGRRYIAFYDSVEPRLSPARVLVGPKADPNIDHIVNGCPIPPSIIKVDFPLA